MWDSLSKLAALPDDTIVYSGHEYTQANAAFAEAIEPGNPDLQARIADIANARAENKPTVPSSLALELATNPFLRPQSVEIRDRLEMQDASDAEVFAEVRARKDAF
jgi:hydroxyacylglutathione hydrolase